VKARALIAGQKPSNPAVALLQHTLTSALRSKKVDFSKVQKMIDDMVTLLGKEQKTDAEQKVYCEDELDKNDDTKKDLTGETKSLETSIAEMKDSIAVLGEEIAALSAKIADLDKSVAEASEQRKKEHSEFEQVLADNVTAMKLIEMAKNRLNKFYNPKLYVAPPKTTEEASFVQIRAHTQKGFAAPPPPPETFGAYTKKSEDSNGVISMIDLLVKDLDKELQESEVMEKEAQKDYETMMEESSAKRAADSKSLTQKEGSKASTEGELEAEQDKKKATVMDLMATEKYIGTLHGECDWILSNYDARKAARTSESEALVQAKAVLNGADFSLLQTSKRLRGA